MEKQQHFYLFYAKIVAYPRTALLGGTLLEGTLLEGTRSSKGSELSKQTKIGNQASVSPLFIR